MNWLIFAVLSATSFGFYNFFTKLSADKFSPTIALLIMTGISFFVALISTVVFRISGQELIFSKNVIWLPIMAGLFAGIAEISYLFMYTKDAPLNIGTPLVVGLTIVVAVLLGVIILKESLDINKVIGICLTIIGLLFLMRN